jgi:hypothetical protein
MLFLLGYLHIGADCRKAFIHAARLGAAFLNADLVLFWYRGRTCRTWSENFTLM